ncbi:tetratricopeptide repeat-containing sensor histidine kinase [Tenacibaculum agarivorans]|uniref:tetratricopeptide repeat-containing sensor histidine kinase n=1 Tax=Tenacibaculum agarivorans TaxID=1908389 RepID=UPI00094BA4D0|nr:tetratricopeptide repeat-containing sensor histidine kinase [Tenacibaculum agarivorans]
MNTLKILVGLIFFSYQLTSQGVDLENSEKEKIQEVFALFNTGKVEEAYAQAHKLKKSSKTTYGISNANLLLANYFKSKSLIDSSMIYVNTFLRLIEKHNDSLSTRGKILGYKILGSNYSTQGLFDESRKWFFKGIEETKKYNEKGLYYQLTFGLANAYNYKGETTKALALFKECLQYKKNKEIVYGSYVNIGIAHANNKNYKLSNQYLEKAQDLSREEGNLKALSVILFNLADNAQALNERAKAIYLLDEVVKISTQKQYHKLRLNAKMNIGSNFIYLKDYKNAELIFSNALIDAKELKLLNEEVTALEQLKFIALEKQDYKKAYTFSNQLSKVKKNIAEKQNLDEIRELEVRYETFKKDKEIQILKIEKEKKALLTSKQKSIRNIIIIALVVLLIPVIISLIIYRQKLSTQQKMQLKDNELSNQKIEKLMKEQELKLVKANLVGQENERKRIAKEIHDSIGGNLAAIKLQVKNPKLSQQINETYEELRSLSHDLIKKKLVKDTFYNILEGYIKNICNASNIELVFEVNPKGEELHIKEDVEIELFKVIQELMTNVIKHAKAKTIEFHMNLYEDNSLNVLFADDGVGFDITKKEEGLGLASVRERVRNINGILQIDSYKGTIVNIMIKNARSKLQESLEFENVLLK